MFISDHPIIGLLEIFTKSRPDFVNDGTNIGKFLSISHIPVFNRDDLFIIGESLRKGRELRDSMFIITNQFVFDEKLIEYLPSFDGIKIRPKSYIHATLLKIIVSWICNDINVNSYIYFAKIIGCLQLLNGVILRNQYIYLLDFLILDYNKTDFSLNNDSLDAIFSHSICPSFHSYVSTLRKLRDEKKNREEPMIIEKFLLFLVDNIETYNDVDIRLFCEYIEPLVFTFDICPMNILATVAAHNINSSLSSLFERFGVFLYKKINEYDSQYSFPVPIRNELYSMDTYQPKMEIELGNTPGDTFPDGIKTLSHDLYQTDLRFDTMLNEDLFCLIKRIVPILCSINEEYFIIFMNTLCNLFSSNPTINMTLILLYILSRTRKVDVTNTIKYFLYSPVLFEPGVSLYNQCTNFSIINFFRKSVIDMGVSTAFFLSNLLKTQVSHPFLFADTIGRIHLRLNDISISSIVEESSLSCIIRIVSVLTCYIELFPTQYQSIQYALSSIFVFLFGLLENPSSSLPCFLSPVFSFGFLSKISETHLQSPILSSFLMFFSNYNDPNVEKLKPLIEFFVGIINVSRSNRTTEQYNLVVNIIYTIRDSMVHSPRLSSIFLPLCEVIASFLINNPEEILLNAFLHFILQLLINVKDYHLNSTLINIIGKGILLIEKDLISDSTLLLLKSMLARSRTLTFDSVFFIEEPNVIMLMLSIANNRSKLISILNLFMILCRHSIENCIKCHQGNLDRILLESLTTSSNSFSFDQCSFVIELSEDEIHYILLPIVFQINSYVSSVDIPIKIMSAISSNIKSAEKELSYIAELDSVISYLATEPDKPLDLGYFDSAISFRDIGFKDGISFKFSYAIDYSAASMNNLKLNIVTFLDYNQRSISFYFHGNNLMIQYSCSQSPSNITLISGISSFSWKTILISISFFDDFTASLSLFHGDSKAKYYSFGFPGFSSMNIDIILGGSQTFLNNSYKPLLARIGNFLVFGKSIANDEADDILNHCQGYNENIAPLVMWPAENVSISGNSMFLNKRNLLTMFQTQENSCFLCTYFQDLSLLSNQFIYHLMDIILAVLSYGSQSLFNFFPLLSHFLKQSDSKSLTSSLYQKFVSLFHACNSLQIQESLFHNILYNFEIWVSSKGKELLKIVNSFTTLVITRVIDSSMITLSELLTRIRIYFWFEPIETEHIQGFKKSIRKRDSELDIRAIRDLFDTCLIHIGSFAFSKSDFVFMLSQCSTCSDKEQTIRFLHVLYTIISVKMPESIPDELSKYLLVHFRPNSETRFIYALKIYYLISKGRILENINHVIMKMNAMFYSNTLFRLLLDEMIKFPMIYPLCFIFSQNLGENAIIEFTKSMINLTINDKFIEASKYYKFWSLPLLILLFQVPNIYKDMLNGIIATICILLKSFIFEIQVIQILCWKLGREKKDFLNPFVLKIVSLGQDLPIEIQKSIFDKSIACFYLKINPENHSNLLLDEFIRSPFYSGESFTGKNEIRYNNQFPTIQAVSQLFSNSVPPLFGISVSVSDYGCVDIDLVEVLISLYENISELCEKDYIVIYKFLLGFSDKPKFYNQIEINNQMSQYAQNIFHKMISNEQKQIVETIDSLCIHFSAICDGMGSVVSPPSSALIGLSTISIDSCLQIFENHRLNEFLSYEKFIKNCIIDFGLCTYLTGKYAINTTFLIKYIQKIYDFVPYSSFIINITPKPDLKRITNVFVCSIMRKNSLVCAYIIIEERMIKIMKNPKDIDLNSSIVSSIYIKSLYHLKTAFEVLMVNGKTYYVVFEPPEAEKFTKAIKGQFFMKSYGQIDDEITQNWCKGSISNYEYIMHLNNASGRSFFDNIIYPIFPKIDVIDKFSCKLICEKSNDENAGYSRSEKSVITPDLVNVLNKCGDFSSYIEMMNYLDQNYAFFQFTPEFYCSIDQFRSLHFPNWTLKSEDIVYQNRVFLESDFVSHLIPQWIDHIFGVDSKNLCQNPLLYSTVWKDFPDVDPTVIYETIKKAGQMPIQLFFKKHPKRENTKPNDKNNCELNLGLSIKSAIFHSPSLIEYIDNIGTHKLFNFQTGDSEKIDVFGEETDLFQFCHYFIIINHRQSIFKIIGNRKSFLLSEKLYYSRFFSIDNNSLYGVDINNSIWKQNMLSNTITRLGAVYFDSVNAIICNEQLGLCIIGTRNGKIIGISLRTGNIKFSTIIKSLPNQILITKSWSFIVVVSDDSIFLLSLSGNIINQKTVPFKIKHIDTWQMNGFDFLVCSDDKGSIRTCEAYYLNIDRLSYSAKGEIILLTVLENKTIAIVRKDGVIRLFSIE